MNKQVKATIPHKKPPIDEGFANEFIACMEASLRDDVLTSVQDLDAEQEEDKQMEKMKKDRHRLSLLHETSKMHKHTASNRDTSPRPPHNEEGPQPTQPHLKR